MSCRLWLFGALLVAGCADVSTDTAAPVEASVPGSIVIGVAGPMTGELAAFGEQLLHGAELAVADMNAAGGINGRQLELVEADDRCDPDAAAPVAEDLVAKGAVAVVGHFCAGASIRAAEVYARAGVLQLTPSTHPYLTDKAAEQKVTTLLRVVGRDDAQGTFAADWILATHGKGRVVVLDDSSPYGRSITQSLLARFRDQGLKPRLVDEMAHGQTGFSDLMAKLRVLDPDVIYLGGYYDDIGVLAWNIRAAGLDAELVGSDSLNAQRFPGIAGSAADGVRFSDLARAEIRPEAAETANRLAAAAVNPGGYTLYSYAAVEAFAAAAKGTGGTDAAALGAYLLVNKVQSVIGELAWDSKGDLVSSAYGWYIWRDGEVQPE
jgi:branched-chain amino acid transport system substrate-binding protein